MIPGTQSISDFLSWPGVLLGPYGRKWHQSEALARRFTPSSFVGHSLGATYALELANRSGRSYRGYGRPGLLVRPGDVMNLGDPVSFFALGYKRTGWGHGLSSYAER